MAQSAQERLVRYIQDAHAEEVGAVTALKDFVDEVTDPQLKAAFQEHLQVTQSQAQRLEARLSALGSGASSGKGFLNTLMAKGADLLQGAHDEYDKNTQAAIKGYATESLEVGMYTSLASYAQALGDNETVALAQQILSEEKAAADKLFPMIAPLAKSALAGATDTGVAAGGTTSVV